MFTIEHEFDSTVITLVDEGQAPLQEDVVVNGFEECVTVEQYMTKGRIRHKNRFINRPDARSCGGHFVTGRGVFAQRSAILTDAPVARISVARTPVVIASVFITSVFCQVRCANHSKPLPDWLRQKFWVAQGPPAGMSAGLATLKALAAVRLPNNSAQRYGF